MTPVDTLTQRKPTARLALSGGPPVCSTPWPAWPQSHQQTTGRLESVLKSRRWAVSGQWSGNQPMDRVFADRFADFTGSRWCIPVDHGSNAILAALTALDIGPGDEVIVPGLTWVACASAVIRAGAIPILVDIEPATLCLDPRRVGEALTPATAAILVVHLYSAMANMDELRHIAAAAGLPIIEDAAQAHGAHWMGRVAGSLGDIGTFSMQQGKILTSGEGGAVVTSDPALAKMVEQLRGDGRSYLPEGSLLQDGRPDLDEACTIQGWNMHLSEFQAALLLDGLERLPEQNALRAKAAKFLDSEFARIAGVRVIQPHPANTERSYYHYVLRIEPEAFADRPIEAICSALTAELGSWVHPTYQPLDRNPLYKPLTHPFARLPGYEERLDPRRFELPEAHRQAKRTILFHHSLLLSPREQLCLLVEAIDKVRLQAHLLPELR